MKVRIEKRLIAFVLMWALLLSSSVTAMAAEGVPAGEAAAAAGAGGAQQYTAGGANSQGNSAGLEETQGTAEEIKGAAGDGALAAEQDKPSLDDSLQSGIAEEAEAESYAAGGSQVWDFNDANALDAWAWLDGDKGNSEAKLEDQALRMSQMTTSGATKLYKTDIGKALADNAEIVTVELDIKPDLPAVSRDSDNTSQFMVRVASKADASVMPIQISFSRRGAENIYIEAGNEQLTMRGTAGAYFDGTHTLHVVLEMNKLTKRVMSAVTADNGRMLFQAEADFRADEALPESILLMHQGLTQDATTLIDNIKAYSGAAAPIKAKSQAWSFDPNTRPGTSWSWVEGDAGTAKTSFTEEGLELSQTTTNAATKIYRTDISSAVTKDAQAVTLEMDFRPNLPAIAEDGGNTSQFMVRIMEKETPNTMPIQVSFTRRGTERVFVEAQNDAATTQTTDGSYFDGTHTLHLILELNRADETVTTTVIADDGRLLFYHEDNYRVAGAVPECVGIMHQAGSKDVSTTVTSMVVYDGKSDSGHESAVPENADVLGQIFDFNAPSSLSGWSWLDNDAGPTGTAKLENQALRLAQTSAADATKLYKTNIDSALVNAAKKVTVEMDISPNLTHAESDAENTSQFMVRIANADDAATMPMQISFKNYGAPAIFMETAGYADDQRSLTSYIEDGYYNGTHTLHLKIEMNRETERVKAVVTADDGTELFNKEDGFRMAGSVPGSILLMHQARTLSASTLIDNIQVYTEKSGSYRLTAAKLSGMDNVYEGTVSYKGPAAKGFVVNANLSNPDIAFCDVFGNTENREAQAIPANWLLAANALSSTKLEINMAKRSASEDLGNTGTYTELFRFYFKTKGGELTDGAAARMLTAQRSDIRNGVDGWGCYAIVGTQLYPTPITSTLSSDETPGFVTTDSAVTVDVNDAAYANHIVALMAGKSGYGAANTIIKTQRSVTEGMQPAYIDDSTYTLYHSAVFDGYIGFVPKTGIAGTDVRRNVRDVAGTAQEINYGIIGGERGNRSMNFSDLYYFDKMVLLDKTVPANDFERILAMDVNCDDYLTVNDLMALIRGYVYGEQFTPSVQ